MSERWRVCREFSRLRRYQDLADHEETKLLVDQMRLFAQDFEHARLDAYWHRKSGKVVLAVLMLRTSNGYDFVRGINSELSLVSGSICAERAAISAALSHHLSLSRTDFVAIAVLSPRMDNPIAPCGVCDEWLKKIQEASPAFTVVTFPDTRMNELFERCPATFVEEITADQVPS